MLSLLLKVFTYLLEKQHETTDARATHILQPAEKQSILNGDHNVWNWNKKTCHRKTK